MSLIASPVIAAFNHLLEQAPWARDRLAMFPDCVVRLQVSPADIRLLIDSWGYVGPSPDEHAEPDVTVTLPMRALPGALNADPPNLLAAARIEGNADLADALGYLFRNLRWDAEEDLSHVIGDIAAHRAMGLLQSIRAAHAHAVESVSGNLAEYIAQEPAPVVGGRACASFAAEVSALRDALARLEKRTDRLVGKRARKKR